MAARERSKTASVTMACEAGPAAGPLGAVASQDMDHPLHSWDAAEAAQTRGMRHTWFPCEPRQADTCSRCNSKFSPWSRKALKCSGCHRRVHYSCEGTTEGACRRTFEKAMDPCSAVPATTHHWVPSSANHQGKCALCNKSIASLSRFFGGKSNSMRCAWCKRVMHKACYSKMEQPLSPCDMGAYSQLILPASSIVLQPKQDLQRERANKRHSYADDALSKALDAHLQKSGIAFAPVLEEEQQHPLTRRRASSHGSISSLLSDGRAPSSSSLNPNSSARSPLFKTEAQAAKYDLCVRTSNRRAAETSMDSPEFSIVSPGPDHTPLLVFINPKSGGNQGVRLIPQFQWRLNPRQVFNLMAKDPRTGKPYGPRRGLEIFKDVPNLRILVCGGDGTVGWVLETIDQMGLSHKHFPVSTLPLGTGNDLSRALKWGKGFEDRMSIDKFIEYLLGATTTLMDRWSIDVTLGQEQDDAAAADSDDAQVKVDNDVPQQILNNYFSVGSDAYAALKFHLAREANPKAFNSRMRNQAIYAVNGAKEMVQHKFRHLSSYITLKCDGEDYTELLQRKRIEAVALLNIPSYAAGTNPWGTKAAVDGFDAPHMDDGKLEVIGFESAWVMAKQQLRLGHALRICQASHVQLQTSRPLPVQVDGEPCMLASCTIQIGRRNQATMMCRPKGRFKNSSAEGLAVPPDGEGEGEGEGEGVVADDTEVASAAHQALKRTKTRRRPDSPQLSADQDDVLSDDESTREASVVFVKLFVVKGPDYTVDTSGWEHSIPLPCEMKVLHTRSLIGEQLGVTFSFQDGWRFLRFEPTGAALKLSRLEERTSAVKDLLRLDAGVNGLFLVQDPVMTHESTGLDGLFLQLVADGEVDEVHRVLELGANLDATDGNGQSALHIAALNDHSELVARLLKHWDCDPNAADHQQRTALHCAAFQGNIGVCELLLENGADPLCTDALGQRPENLAARESYQEIVELLSLCTEAELEPDTETVV